MCVCSKSSVCESPPQGEKGAHYAPCQPSGKNRVPTTPATTRLDLPLSLRQQPRVNNDHIIDFEGRNYEIARTSKSPVTLIHHPQLKFWVVEHPPANIYPPFSPLFLCN